MSIVESDRSAGNYARVPGPVDRESFFTAQARNRRSAWRLTALCVLAVLLLGIPLSAVLAPLFYGTAVLAVDVANFFTPLPDPVRLYFSGSLPIPAFPDSEALEYVVFAIVLAPPGAIFLLLAWLGSRALFLRSGAGGILLTLGAREPKTRDPEERQLVNLVAEMAAAAGVPPPRVLLLDTRAVNAAAVGSSLADGAVVVSRGLLDALDRDETQGIIGHLVGSMGSGDLRMAMTLLSLYQALGAVTAALSCPFSPSARAVVLRLVRLALRRRSPAEGSEAAEAEAVSQLLARAFEGADLKWDDFERQGWVGKVKGYAALPFLGAYVGFLASQKFLGAVLVTPPLTFAWRSRRHLADATAVQLTRNPDGLARALLRLSRPDAAVPGAAWASHLFVTWPGDEGTLGEKIGLLSFQPAIANRLLRLRAMGSTVAAPPPPPRLGRVEGGFQGMTPLAWVLASPFILAFTCLVVGNMMMLSLLLEGAVFLGLFVVPLHFLLRYLAP